MNNRSKCSYLVCVLVLLTYAAHAKKKPASPEEAKRQQFAETYEVSLVRAGQLHGILTENVHVVVGGNKHDGPVLCLELNNGFQTVGRTWLLNFYEQNVIPAKEGLRALGFNRVRVIYTTVDDPTLPRGVKSFDYKLE